MRQGSVPRFAAWLVPCCATRHRPQMDLQIVEQHVHLARHHDGIVDGAGAMRGMPRRQAALGHAVAKALVHRAGIEVASRPSPAESRRAEQPRAAACRSTAARSLVPDRSAGVWSVTQHTRDTVSAAAPSCAGWRCIWHHHLSSADRGDHAANICLKAILRFSFGRHGDACTTPARRRSARKRRDRDRCDCQMVPRWISTSPAVSLTSPWSISA